MVGLNVSNCVSGPEYVLLRKTMKTMLVVLVCAALTSCAAAPSVGTDPIDELAARLNARSGLWINGCFPIIELPPDAKPDQVLAAAVKMTGFDQGHIKSCEILKVRQVELITGGKETFSAALIKSDLGTKILLFKPEKNNRWWTRFYDVEKEKQNKAGGDAVNRAPQLRRSHVK